MLFLLACADYTFTGKFKVPADDSGVTDTPADDTGTAAGDDTAPPADSDSAPVETGDSVPPEPVDCASILVYSTEADDSAGRAGGAFRGLATEASLGAWDVDVRERADVGLLSDSLLEGRSQVWVMGADRDLRTTMDLSEVRALRDFVEGGGGLLVAAGGEGADESYTEDVSGIAEPYGVEFHDSAAEGDDGAPVTPTGTADSLFAGVSTLPGFAAVAELSLNDEAVVSAAKIGGVTSIAWRDDGVRVVFDRTWAGWSDEWRSVGDQAVFVANVAGFLERCED